MAHVNLKDAAVKTDLPLSFQPSQTDAVKERGTHPFTQKPSPYGGLSLSLTSEPEVSRVTIDYTVIQGGEEGRKDEQELSFTGKFDQGGNKIWKLLSMPLPRGVEVRFKVKYRIGRKTHVDDNGGKGYLVTVE